MYKFRINKWYGFLGTCFFVAGCSSFEGRHLGNENDPVLDTFKDLRQVAAEQPHAPPPEVRDFLLSELDAVPALPRAKSIEPRFDISVFQLNAREFFMGLVADSPYNMVVHPHVKGTISLDLKKVTIPEILETVREVYGYEFKRVGIGYIVLPGELQTRIFQVDYLNVVRKGFSETRVTSGQISQSNSRTNRSGNSGDSNNEASITSGSFIETTSKSDFWNELRFALNAIVDPGEKEKVVISSQSGVVVIRALPNKIRAVERFLRKTQNRIQRQVILEAKILEVTLNDQFQSGINWAAIIRIGSNAITFGQTGGGSVLSDGISEIARNFGNLNPDAFVPVDGTATSAFGGTFSALLDFSNFKAFIELLETQGKVHMLSSPRISTLNNQKAVIKVGSDEYFVTDVSVTTVTGVTTQTNPDITLTPFFSGIALDVTPQIGDDGTVTLHIHPSVTRVEDQSKTIIVNGVVQQLPLALSTVRESDSIVKAKSGQIIVIGGLMQDLELDEVARTPWLGTLPYIGPLFRHTRERSRKSELVILLKPLVIDRDEAWTQNMSETEQRFRFLQDGGQRDNSVGP